MGITMNLHNQIKTELLSELEDTFDPSEHDVYKTICETFDLEDTDDLYQEFKAEYQTITESAWWSDAIEEKRAALWYDENIAQTDQLEYQYEKNQTVRKYG